MVAEVAISELAASQLTEYKIPTGEFTDHRIREDVADVEKVGLAQSEDTPATIEGDKPGQLLVDFDGLHDLSNPVNWSKRYKWAIVILLSTVNIITYVSTT